MNKYHIAEINIARMKGLSLDDPIMKEFTENIDAVYALAESSNGFVWRLKDDNINESAVKPFNDEQIIINLSVWESIEQLEQFMYKTFHADFLKRRREWFHRFGKVNTAMWWIPVGELPTLEEAVAQLAYLQKHGASEKVFDFKSIQNQKDSEYNGNSNN